MASSTSESQGLRLLIDFKLLYHEDSPPDTAEPQRTKSVVYHKVLRGSRPPELLPLGPGGNRGKELRWGKKNEVFDVEAGAEGGRETEKRVEDGGDREGGERGVGGGQGSREGVDLRRRGDRA